MKLFVLKSTVAVCLLLLIAPLPEIEGSSNSIENLTLDDLINILLKEIQPKIDENEVFDDEALMLLSDEDTDSKDNRVPPSSCSGKYCGGWKRDEDDEASSGPDKRGRGGNSAYMYKGLNTLDAWKRSSKAKRPDAFSKRPSAFNKRPDAFSKRSVRRAENKLALDKLVEE